MITSKKAPGYVEIVGSNVDGSQNVQVKSNAFLYNTLLFDQAIATLAEVDVMVPTEGFSKIIVMAYGEAAGDVSSTASPDGSIFLAKETLFSVTANTGDSKEVTKIAPNLKVTVKNTSGGTANFHLWIYGV